MSEEYNQDRDAHERHFQPNLENNLKKMIYNTGTNVYQKYLTISNNLKSIFKSSDEPVAYAENRFLRCLKHTYYRYYVEISSDCKIWTLSSLPQGTDVSERSAKPSVLFIHGFIAGLAFWAKNFDNVVDSGFDLYAIDIPGYARSSRIQFSENGNETEEIFVNAFEKWRSIIGLTNILIIGHSFGGYLTCAYSLTYPQFISRLILVDPWGFPDLREEVTEVIERSGASTITAPLLNLPIWIRIISMIFMPFSPFSIIRISGKYFGPKIIHQFRPDMARRYASLFGDEDQTTVPDYIYQINKFKPTGENAFRSMSFPLAWAKEPMIKRIGNLDKNIPLSFIYGSRSWIDYQTGYLVKQIRKDCVVDIHIIEGAGHQLFADEPEAFNSLVKRIITENFAEEIPIDPPPSTPLIP